MIVDHCSLAKNKIHSLVIKAYIIFNPKNQIYLFTTCRLPTIFLQKKKNLNLMHLGTFKLIYFKPILQLSNKPKIKIHLIIQFISMLCFLLVKQQSP